MKTCARLDNLVTLVVILIKLLRDLGAQAGAGPLGWDTELLTRFRPEAPPRMHPMGRRRLLFRASVAPGSRPLRGAGVSP